MPNRQLPSLHRFRPWPVFLLVLVTVFAVEATVMVALPYLLPQKSSFQAAALWDACLLTLTLAPLLWKLAVQPLRKLADERQQLLAWALSAQETERGRIARDLHDGIGQGLTGLLVGLRAIEESFSDEQLRSRIRELRRVGGETHDEIRRIARGLRPAVLDDLGLVPALERFLDDVQSIHKVDATLQCTCPESGRLPSDLETALYRIAQEGVANALRHGKASSVSIILSCDKSGVEMAVDDNGSGFGTAAAPAPEETSFGLSSIRERAWLLGGRATFQSSHGTGSRLTVRIPRTHQDQRHV